LLLCSGFTITGCWPLTRQQRSRQKQKEEEIFFHISLFFMVRLVGESDA
jgi:hypothetical protein